MAEKINIFYEGRSCEVPIGVIDNEVIMKEIVSANVWNNHLKKPDKVNLLKFLPGFQKNETREKKETLKKIFLGKSINFENQIHKFVNFAKEGGFNIECKSTIAIKSIMDKRQSRISLIKKRIIDLQNIIETKRKMGVNVTKEEIACLNQNRFYLETEDPLDSIVDDRFEKLMQEITNKKSTKSQIRLNKIKKECDEYKSNHPDFLSNQMGISRLYNLIKEYRINCNKAVHNTTSTTYNFDIESVTNAISHYMCSRKRKNTEISGCTSGKSLKLHYEECSSAESMSEGSNIFDQENNYLDDEGDCYEEEVIHSTCQFYSGDDESNSENESMDSFMSKKKFEIGYDAGFLLPQHDFTDFFSLIQFLFLLSPNSQQTKRCSTSANSYTSQIALSELEYRVRKWQKARMNISSSNVYFCNVGWIAKHKDWSIQVNSALNFLLEQKSDEFKDDPILEYNKKNQIWVWKKERCADQLSDLFFEWRNKVYENGGDGSNSTNNNNSSNGNNNNKAVLEEVPPSLYSTDWVCRPYTPEEKASFHNQERRRFMRPWRGFVYNVTGYECAVAPLRGCINTAASNSSSSSSHGGNSIDPSAILTSSLNGRARGHPLLLADRPAHVTIVEIVRDAVARLPNGQGSRADIAMLAAESQYWAVSSTEQNHRGIAQCVSSALDRLQGEHGGDPSVKYNSRLKLWFYRHRHKTMAQLELAVIAANAHMNHHNNTQHSGTTAAVANSKATIVSTQHHQPASNPNFFVSNSMPSYVNSTPINTVPAYFHRPQTSHFVHPAPPTPQHISHHSYAYQPHIHAHHSIGPTSVTPVTPVPSITSVSSIAPVTLVTPINLSNTNPGPANLSVGSSYQQFSQAISNARELLQHQAPAHNRFHTPTIRLTRTPSSLAPGTSLNHRPAARVFLYNPVTGQQQRLATSSTGSITLPTRINTSSINNNARSSNNPGDKYNHSNSTNSSNYYHRF